MAIDFEREGLLDGLDDPEARVARLELLRELSEAGVSLEQLKAAIEEDRLAGLPMELVFTRGLRHTLADMMSEVGFDEGFVRRNYLALGLPLPALDEPGDTERDFGLRLAKLSSELMPTLGPLTERPVRLHLRERVRHDVIGFTELTSGKLPDTREVGVYFADLVEFTRLTERVSVEQLGKVTARLETLAGEAAEPPIRLIKLIGDAAMLVSPDVPPLVGAAQGLVEAADQDDLLPRLRAGMAAGQALNRGGDWYGPPVNLASRITDVAEPGTVVANETVVEAAGDAHRWAPLGDQALKGIEQAVSLHQLTNRANPA